MTSSWSTSVFPDNLIVANPAKLASKFAEFTVAGAKGVHAVFDFDRTLTTKKPGSYDEVTTWHILQEHLPKSAQLEYRRLFEKYRALELNGNMTRQDAIVWWSSILNLFAEHRIDLAAVEEDFLARASIRPGAAALLRFLENHHVPTIILSAGIRDVIAIWCRKYEINPSLIIATVLTTDKSNRIVDWDKDTLVHVRNKSEATHHELTAIRKVRPKILLVGDSIDDAGMAAGERDVIRVRIVDPRADEAANGAEEQKTFETFDALIQSGSLRPLHELIKQIL